MPSKDVIALANRIRNEFGIDVDQNKFYRTYVGYHQRAAGECTWVIYSKNGLMVVGGFEPIRKYITKRNRLDIARRRFNEFELYVYAPDEVGYDRLKKQTGKSFTDGIVELCFDDEEDSDEQS